MAQSYGKRTGAEFSVISTQLAKIPEKVPEASDSGCFFERGQRGQTDLGEVWIVQGLGTSPDRGRTGSRTFWIPAVSQEASTSATSW